MKRLFAIAAVMTVVLGLGVSLVVADPPNDSAACHQACARQWSDDINNCSGSSSCVQWTTEQMRQCMAACSPAK